ncbi:MAG: hypothetical protein ABFR36_01430 [Acidobacteriota bacterium]
MKRTVIIITILFFLAGCGSSDKRSEIEIAIYKAVDAAVENDVDQFMTFIDYDYLDGEERIKPDIQEKVENYLNRFRVISINILNIKTVQSDNDTAEVVAEINFSHGLGKMLSKVFRSYGESYRFHLDMVRRSRGWAVKQAKWEWMSLEDLYPESLKVLRELFPDAL